ncbi:MAG: hypothetical protein LBN22_02485 [Clostridiales Family XIII bacterium]|jgi:hypothetical protein|nr:hypothetical protein [Clostridiales Family XIII bacterium]
MMNIYLKKRIVLHGFVIIVMVVFVLSLMSVVTPASYEANAAPAAYNLTLEYHYVKGQTPPQIAQNLSRFGRNYNLIGQSDPILEDTLPIKRSYSYRIDGIMTQDDIDQLRNTDGLISTPVAVEMEREVNITATFKQVSWNDAKALPLTQEFQVTSAKDANGKLADVTYDSKGKLVAGVGVPQKAILKRAGAKFAVSETDANGLPLGYTAEAVYRGLETYAQAGYFEVSERYTTKADDNVERYIIQAVYELVDLPAGTTYPGGGTPTVAGTTATPSVNDATTTAPPSTTDTGSGTTAEEPADDTDTDVMIPETEIPTSPIDDDTADIPTTEIDDPLPPVAPPILPPDTDIEPWALLNLLLAFFGLVFAIVFISKFATKKKGEDSEISFVSMIVTAALIGILAIANVVLFFATQNLNNERVMIDAWTILSIVLFGVELIVSFTATSSTEKDEDSAAE